MTDDSAVALGFDFGLRRIGVAVGSRATGSSSPTASVPCRDGRPDWLAIGRIVEEWRPAVLVVGLPYNMDGSESEMTRRARRFGHRLEARFRVPVAFVDERLSSREARERLSDRRRRGERPRVRKHEVDELAAAIILENWLNAIGQKEPSE
ncbi:MAG: Holliday junction resolvase RuvX [Gammaproteobacteria bacterium]